MITRGTAGLLLATTGLLLGACDSDLFLLPDEPDAPRDLTAHYYNRGVDLQWTLGPDWRGESFLVYGKREEDRDYFFIAEVTSCIEAHCLYRDINVVGGATYEYYVSAYDAETGLETPSDRAVLVDVPRPIPPAVPEGVAAVALDGAVYLHWDDSPALEDDFLAYRVHASAADGYYLVGETDSPGFMDLLAANGHTTRYYVTSVDDQGHESDGSEVAEATPRVDYAGEVMYAHQDLPAASGFRFQESDDLAAVMAGDSAGRHFRIDRSGGALWLEPGPGARVHPDSRWTTALKCGPGADPDCESWETAPLSGYGTRAMPLEPGHTYMFRVPGDDGEIRFGAIRATIIGLDQEGDELVVFDWAYQPQAGNPSLDQVDGVG